MLFFEELITEFGGVVLRLGFFRSKDVCKRSEEGNLIYVTGLFEFGFVLGIRYECFRLFV